jgi:hypothetical protein
LDHGVDVFNAGFQAVAIAHYDLRFIGVVPKFWVFC